VLRPRLTSTGSAAASRLRLSPHWRHPGRPPRIRAVTFPLLPPRVPHCPVGGVGLRRRGPAHPGGAASYAVRVPRCRGLSPASCRPRLATPPLPSTRSFHRLPPEDSHLLATAHAGRTPSPGFAGYSPDFAADFAGESCAVRPRLRAGGGVLA